MKRLDRQFFNRPTLKVAKELIGKEMVFGEKRARIIETEAYIGEDDPACHAARGMTKRNEVMFGAAGHAYVYLIYGMHYCLNFVTEKEGFPAAVLVRGAEPKSGFEEGVNLVGPGRLTRGFGITKMENGTDICSEVIKLYVQEGEESLGRGGEIVASGRVGIREGREKLWRFRLYEN